MNTALLFFGLALQSEKLPDPDHILRLQQTHKWQRRRPADQECTRPMPTAEPRRFSRSEYRELRAAAAQFAENPTPVDLRK